MQPEAQPSAGWMEGLEHVLPVRIYYEDTDFTGVVYHGAYVRFFERGRTDFLRIAGVSHAALLERPDPLAFTVTRLAIDFKRSARIDDALVVRTHYEAVRGPRLFIRQRVLRGETLVADAEVEAACIDLAGRARRPPPDLVQALQPFFASGRGGDLARA
jgi:acyl-CoA thioester hydrolase